MTSKANPSDLRVLFIGAEADPFARVGGLGDASGAFPRAISAIPAADLGGIQIDMRLVIPYYGVIDPAAYSLKPVSTFPVPYRQGAIQARVFFTELQGLPVYLIAGDPILSNAPISSTDGRLDGRKFTFFSLAALELCRQLKWAPNILHANDWHTALAVYALKSLREQDKFFASTRSVLTIHNLSLMGAGGEGSIPDFQLKYSENPSLPEWARRLPLALGIEAADAIVTVSPTYAREILTEEFGNGLQDYLKTRSADLFGLLDGIDTSLWNPMTEASPVAHFSAENMGPRSLNKRAIQSRFSFLEDDQTPLLIAVGRMDSQRGADLTLETIRRAAWLNWQAVLLGTGDSELEAEARQLENEFPDRLRAIMRFDDRLAHVLYAGGDMLLMPSRYEPCGLSQMIAMRYGCVPIARATGGLVDTIQDYSKSQQSTGFLFDEPSSEALFGTLTRALDLYPDNSAWSALQKRGMLQDFSWKRSAKAYADLYRSLKDLKP